MTKRTQACDTPVFLVGFMASGKSTVGPLLAEKIGAPYVDTDKQLEERFGVSVAEIFRQKGEQTFRDAERELIVELVDGPMRVVAAGGGAFIDAHARATLRRRARTIWLDPPFETLRSRLEQCKDRPIAATSSEAQLRELWERRRLLYAAADLRIETFDMEATSIVEEIITRLKIA